MMLEMTRTINTDWKPHVKATGVTCYTCHRGQAVPAEVWFDQPRPRSAGGATPEAEGHNHPNPVTALSAIDNNVLVRYLLGNRAHPCRWRGPPADAALRGAHPAGRKYLRLHDVHEQGAGQPTARCATTRARTPNGRRVRRSACRPGTVSGCRASSMWTTWCR
jgi:hypothetical protein